MSTDFQSVKQDLDMYTVYTLYSNCDSFTVDTQNDNCVIVYSSTNRIESRHIMLYETTEQKRVIKHSAFASASFPTTD